MGIRNKKAQVAIISLWVVIILAVMAVGLGHRTSMGLRLSRYQKDKQKALYLAKAALNKAISEIEKDEAAYDSLNDGWAALKVTDEERKININTASKELLAALLEEYNLASVEDKLNNILIWRGDLPDDAKIYADLGYPAKAGRFVNCQELLLVKGFEPEEYQLFGKIITVYSGLPININTASSAALNIFAYGIAKELSLDKNFAYSVADKIIELRNTKGYFQAGEDVSIALTGEEETNIFNALINRVTFQSHNFFIEVSGNVGKIKSKVEAVYNRADKKIVYWHES